MKFLDDFLFVDQPASFTSSYDVNESIERLLKASVRSPFQVLFKQKVVGIVSRDEVVLARGIPFSHNDFAPKFYGSFREENGVAILTGRFSTQPWTRRSTIFSQLCVLVPFVVYLRISYGQYTKGTRRYQIQRLSGHCCPFSNVLIWNWSSKV